jgi:hypothetical protein
VIRVDKVSPRNREINNISIPTGKAKFPIFKGIALSKKNKEPRDTPVIPSISTQIQNCLKRWVS